MFYYNMSYYDKYLKYKLKYLGNKLIGGSNPTSFKDLITNIDTYVPPETVDKERLINEKINYLITNGGNINDIEIIINEEYPEYPTSKSIVDLVMDTYNPILIKQILLHPNTIISETTIDNLLSDGCGNIDYILIVNELILNKKMLYDEVYVQSLISLLKLIKSECNDELIERGINIDILIEKIDKTRKSVIIPIELKKILIPISYRQQILNRKPMFNFSDYTFDMDDTTELYKLVKNKGLKDPKILKTTPPLTVKKKRYNGKEYYEVIDGRHRLFFYLLNKVDSVTAIER